MTALIVNIIEAQTTKELHRLMYDNLRLFNKYPVLDFYARKRSASLRRVRAGLTGEICTN